VLDDAQIAAVVVNANAIDSAFGELAKEKSATKAVYDFADRVITEHGGVNRQAVTLAERLHIEPERSDAVRELQADAEQVRQTLEGLTGSAFDSAYIEHEVAFHQRVLETMDRALIPGAQDAELKRLVSQSRPVIASHLSRARSIQKALRKS
jgi:putative membrane protein